jgi:hypothetical protein
MKGDDISRVTTGTADATVVKKSMLQGQGCKNVIRDLCCSTVIDIYLGS